MGKSSETVFIRAAIGSSMNPRSPGTIVQWGFGTSQSNAQALSFRWEENTTHAAPHRPRHRLGDHSVLCQEWKGKGSMALMEEQRVENKWPFPR